MYVVIGYTSILRVSRTCDTQPHMRRTQMQEEHNQKSIATRTSVVDSAVCLQLCRPCRPFRHPHVPTLLCRPCRPFPHPHVPTLLCRPLRHPHVPALLCQPCWACRHPRVLMTVYRLLYLRCSIYVVHFSAHYSDFVL